MSRIEVKIMRKSIIINSDDMVTLFLILQLMNNILSEGLNKDNTELLQDMQYELTMILARITKK